MMWELVGVTLWILVLGFAIALSRAATRGDKQKRRAENPCDK